MKPQTPSEIKTYKIRIKQNFFLFSSLVLIQTEIKCQVAVHDWQTNELSSVTRFVARSDVGSTGAISE
jgi:hypothetical protein